MNQSWKRRYIIVLVFVMITLSFMKANIESTYFMPFGKSEYFQKTDTIRGLKEILYAKVDFFVEDNVVLKQNLEAGKNRFLENNVIIFVIAVVITVLPYFIYSSIRNFFRGHTLSLLQIVAYIHSIDGKKRRDILHR